MAVLRGLSGFILAISLGSAAHAACEGRPTDKADVAAAVQGFFDALGVGEAGRLAETTTADFYAFDVGKRYTGPALAAVIAEAKATASVPVWSLQDMDIRLGCDTAWAAWINRGSVGPRERPTPIVWLESAALRRVDGRWRLEFLHSSRAAADVR